MIYNKNNLLIKEFCGDDARPVLAGVAFYHNKSVATDSCVLAEVSTPNIDKNDAPIIPNHRKLNYLQSEPVIISKEGVGKVLKNLPLKTTLPVLSTTWLGDKTNADFAEFLLTDLETATPILTRRTEGEFPDYKKIIPNEKTTFSVSFNPEVLAKVFSFLAKIGLRNCKLDFYGNNKPLVIRAETEEKQKVRILVMPLRVDE